MGKQTKTPSTGNPLTKWNPNLPTMANIAKMSKDKPVVTSNYKVKPLTSFGTKALPQANDNTKQIKRPEAIVKPEASKITIVPQKQATISADTRSKQERDISANAMAKAIEDPSLLETAKEFPNQLLRWVGSPESLVGDIATTVAPKGPIAKTFPNTLKEQQEARAKDYNPYTSKGDKIQAKQDDVTSNTSLAALGFLPIGKIPGAKKVLGKIGNKLVKEFGEEVVEQTAKKTAPKATKVVTEAIKPTAQQLAKNKAIVDANRKAIEYSTKNVYKKIVNPITTKGKTINSVVGGLGLSTGFGVMNDVSRANQLNKQKEATDFFNQQYIKDQNAKQRLDTVKFY